MKDLIKRFAGCVKGCITGFDRIVFKGLIMPLMSADGAMSFCRAKRIKYKEYKSWMMKHTNALVNAAEEYAKANCGNGIIPIATWRARKEDLAHERQRAEQINTGLIGVWSCVEACSSYRARYSNKTSYPQLKFYQTRCKHLYYYFDHPIFGFMNIRFQTWFPYHIQICLNGRQWLKRSLENKGIGFLAKGNKFCYLSDYEKAQHFLDNQLDTRWADMLNGFLPTVFPTMGEILGPHLSYYWTMWQSEWASDLIFDTPDSLNPIMNSLIRHAHITGTSTRVLRYLDRPLRLDGKPYINCPDDVFTRVMDFNDGIRIRHWVGNNSVKAYNEQNVLRLEMTMNRPEKFRVFRHKQGQSPAEKKSRLPLRKSVADIPLRSKVSQEVIDRFASDLATLHESTPVYELYDEITRPRTQKGKRFRALDPIGKDRDLFKAISDPAYRVSAITNKALRDILKNTTWGKNPTDRQLSARISRHLRLLRAHGIVRKLPNQNKYQVTLKGMRLANTLNAFLATSTENLLKMAA